MKVYRDISSKLAAIDNCKKSGNTVWQAKHEESIASIIKECFPSGLGFDAGTILIHDESSPEKLVFSTAFHHMSEHGYYEGWSHHRVIVTPSLVHGINIKVTGRNKNDIKDYIAEVFYNIGSLTLETGVA